MKLSITARNHCQKLLGNPAVRLISVIPGSKRKSTYIALPSDNKLQITNHEQG